MIFMILTMIMMMNGDDGDDDDDDEHQDNGIGFKRTEQADSFRSNRP